jgi:hypothetical protein
MGDMTDEEFAAAEAAAEEMSDTNIASYASLAAFDSICKHVDGDKYRARRLLVSMAADIVADGSAKVVSEAPPSRHGRPVRRTGAGRAGLRAPETPLQQAAANLRSG